MYVIMFSKLLDHIHLLKMPYKIQEMAFSKPLISGEAFPRPRSFGASSALELYSSAYTFQTSLVSPYLDKFLLG